MTQHSPHPADATNDVNTLLDALVSGKRAPETGSASDLDALAAVHVHRLVSGDAAADVSARPSEQTLDEIWRNVMQPHAIVPAADNGFVPPQSARQKARLRAIPERPPVSRFQTLVSMGAVAAMLIVLIGAAWMGRGGGGPVDPEPVHYAAQPLQSGTPEAVDDWTTFTMLKECEPREVYSDDQIAAIIATPQAWPERAYGPVSDASGEDAAAVIRTLRSFVACSLIREELGAYFSTRFYANLVPEETTWSYSLNGPAGKEISEAYAEVPPTDFIMILDEPLPYGTPPPGVESFDTTARQAFHQRHVIQLADGRLAVPMSGIFSTHDEAMWMTMQANWSSFVHVLVEEEGELRIDEMLPFCVGACDEYWAQMEEAESVAVGNPDATPYPTGWAAEAPLSPDAWMQPISWETCTADPMASGEYVEIIQSDIDLSGRSYEMVGPPAPEDKAEALAALRNFTACRWVPYGQNDGGMERALSTDAYLWTNANAVSGSEAVEYREASPAFEELEDHFLGLPRSAYEIVLESSAPQEVQDIWEQRTAPAATRNLNVGAMGDELVGGGYPYSISVFDPALSVELEDGRIAFLTTTISWSGDPDIAWLGANPYRSIAVSIMAEEEGEWRFDEEIWLCGEGCQSVEFMPDMMVGDDGAVLENEPKIQSRGASPLPAQSPLMVISAGDQPDTVAVDERLVFVQTEDGRLGWVRQVDIVPYVPDASPVATPES